MTGFTFTDESNNTIKTKNDTNNVQNKFFYFLNCFRKEKKEYNKKGGNSKYQFEYYIQTL